MGIRIILLEDEGTAPDHTIVSVIISGGVHLRPNMLRNNRRGSKFGDQRCNRHRLFENDLDGVIVDHVDVIQVTVIPITLCIELVFLPILQGKGHILCGHRQSIMPSGVIY
ncbi:MAG: hypothetical protein A4E50_00996 [Methanosaeta sp. PtaB.Bin087]|nr:MAG: hypothetical protein A4E50_00996 [Methanosaeta sp. PtaB.Bin087]